MIDKLLKPISKLGRLKLKGLPKAFIIIIVGLLITSILMYLSGCFFIWYLEGKPPLKDINVIITTLTSVPAIAAVGFLGKAMVDDDGDGTPNIWEEKGIDDEKSRPDRIETVSSGSTRRYPPDGPCYGQKSENLSALDRR